MPAAKRHRFNGPCSILSLNPAKISPSHRSPSELLDVALPQPGQAAEKECPFQYFFLIGRFGKPYQFLLAQMLPYGGDALDAV